MLPGTAQGRARSGGRSRIAVLDLTTGQASSVALGRSFPYSAAGILTGNGGEDSTWNIAGPAILGTGNSGQYARLEGIDPQTGHILWHGPWAGDVHVRGQSASGLSVVITESCAPAGIEVNPVNQDPGTYCDSERLYAINS
jgi:hypothetical protein